MSFTRECGVCWYVYDPALGDEVWQVPPGTAFDALPEDWRCPRCDSGKERFLPPKDELPLKPALKRLVEAYDEAAHHMKDLPIFNPALKVEAVGFRDFDGGQLGVVVTPWFMNLVFVPGPAESSTLKEGEPVTHALPAGPVEFFGARLDHVGPFESCSLFSPMPQFDSAEAARATAEEALKVLFIAPVVQAPPAQQSPSRRDLFRGFQPR